MIPNNNQEVLSILAEKLRKKNRGRNMVLLCAVAVGIVTLTLIFRNFCRKDPGRVYESGTPGRFNSISSTGKCDRRPVPADLLPELYKECREKSESRKSRERGKEAR